MSASLYKDTFRTIKKRYKIFLSILVMSLLGVGFFAGLKATAPNMDKTLSKYLEEVNFYDLEIFSPEGFEEIENLKEVDKYQDHFENFSLDLAAEFKNQALSLKVLSLSDEVNKIKQAKNIDLKENEFLLDSKYADEIDIKMGDSINLKTEFLKNKTLTLVGLIDSPLFIHHNRGTTNIGTGHLDSFIYINKDNLVSDITTSIYVKMDYDKALFAPSYEKQVNSFKKKVQKLNKSWIIKTRNDNFGISSYQDDIERIANIASIFPIMFFVVAILISLTSMTRMVEEERTQIGTLKALGYKNQAILNKFMTFATLACFFGGLLGAFLGSRFLPLLIYDFYSNEYSLNKLYLSLNLFYSIMGLAILMLSVVGATLYACYRSLKERPAQLMRPKAPKSGKRVFLEKINGIWKRLSFTSKVTIRNVFRYKKRFFMTVIGVAASTALIVAGFGLKSSVEKMIDKQYKEIFNYDLMLISNGSNTDEVKELAKKDELESIETFFQTLSVHSDKKTVEGTNLFLLNNFDNDLINLKQKNKKIDLNHNEIAITKKLAELLDIKEGSTIKLKNLDNLERYVTVDKIVDNYLHHYIYMTKRNYENIFDEEISYNSFLIKYLTKVNETKLSEKFLKSPSVMTIVSTRENRKIMDEVVKKLNYVSLILILAAATLAFAVLYTLSNVNISERLREITTIKVLGFKDHEVHNYIANETNFLSFIGLILGLIGGYFVNILILKTAELDVYLFPTQISWYYYIYAILITVGFAFIVSIINSFALKKIDMIESLKSVE